MSLFQSLLKKIIMEQSLEELQNQNLSIDYMQKKMKFHNVIDPILQADYPKFQPIKDDIIGYKNTILNYPLYVKIQFHDKTKIQSMEQAVYVWFTQCVELYNSWDKEYTIAYAYSFPHGEEDSDDYWKSNSTLRTFKLTMDCIYAGFPAQCYRKMQYEWQRIPIFEHKEDWQVILDEINDGAPKEDVIDLIRQQLEIEKDQIKIVIVQSNKRLKQKQQRALKAQQKEEFMLTHSIPNDVYLNLIDGKKFGTANKFRYSGINDYVEWKPFNEFCKACGIHVSFRDVVQMPIQQALQTGAVVYVQGCKAQKNPNWPQGYVLISDLYYALRHGKDNEAEINDSCKIFVRNEAGDVTPTPIRVIRPKVYRDVRLAAQEKERIQK